ncbi:MAG: D-alanyl-D-alanine carboxypeptidase [Proteobacteria bacterium]|nr:D-alanyl-D-alanine carboxypeptidase [Pseudomonadota bacterium]
MKTAVWAACLLLLASALPPAADAARRPHRVARHAAHQPVQPAAAPQPLHVTIMDGDSGAILHCEDCNAPMPPASMSKLMTALIVGDALLQHRITLDTRYHVSENAWRHGAMSDGSHMFLELNSEVSIRDLIQGVIVVSANDACIVLAEGLAGSESAFVALMNRRAQELGLRSAHFTNATGLPDPNHVISSADLARLARYLVANHPELYRLYGERAFTYNGHTQENRNPLLGTVAGADGLKTGHTDDSGFGLVGSAVQNGHRRILVFNGLRSMADRREAGINLMRAAFEQYATQRIARRGQQLGEAQVYLGSRATAPLVAQNDIVVGGPQAVLAGLRTHVVYAGPLRAPIAQGQVVAQLVVEGPGLQTKRFPLVSGQRIGGANWFAKAWEGLRVTFSGAH